MRYIIVTLALLVSSCAHKQTPDNFNCGFARGETKGREEAVKKLSFSTEWLERCPADMRDETKKGYKAGYLQGIDATDGDNPEKTYFCSKAGAAKDLIVYGRTAEGARKKWGIVCPDSHSDRDCRSLVSCNKRY